MNYKLISRQGIERFKKLKQSKIYNVEKLIRDIQRILVLIPHPDDEIIGCGGALIYHTLQKHSVICCYCTNGSQGNEYDGKAVQIRREEAELVGSYLNLYKLIFWDIEDLKLKSVKMTQTLVNQLILEYKPELIYVPSPFEKHPDHFNTFKILAEAVQWNRHSMKILKEMNTFIHFYNVWNDCPANIYLDITKFKLKKDYLLNLYESQKHFQINKLSNLNNLLSAMRNQLSKGSLAEAFFRIHCSQLTEFWHACEELCKYKGV